MDTPASPGPGRKAAGRQPPWERGADSEPGSFGTWLRRQRELREISLRDVAERTKISLRYLEAMEDDRFDLLPAPVFAKGFLREYARYIGLSPDEVVTHYLAAHGLDGSEGNGEEAEAERATQHPRRRPWLALVILALAIAAAIAAGVYFYLHGRGGGRGPGGEPPAPSAEDGPGAAAPSGSLAAPGRPTVPVVPAAVPVASEAPSPASGGSRAPLEVTLDFTRDCWVEATVDGKPSIAEYRVAGESLPIAAQREVVLTKLGNAGGVEVQVNGYPFPLPVAGQGQVLRDVKIDLETVRLLRERKEAG